MNATQIERATPALWNSAKGPILVVAAPQIGVGCAGIFVGTTEVKSLFISPVARIYRYDETVENRHQAWWVIETQSGSVYSVKSGEELYMIRYGLNTSASGLDEESARARLRSLFEAGKADYGHIIKTGPLSSTRVATLRREQAPAAEQQTSQKPGRGRPASGFLRSDDWLVGCQPKPARTPVTGSRFGQATLPHQREGKPHRPEKEKMDTNTSTTLPAAPAAQPAGDAAADAPARKWFNKLALLSAGLSLSGYLMLPICGGILGVLVGIIALIQDKNAAPGGKPLAWVGIGLGLFNLIVPLCFLIFGIGLNICGLILFPGGQ